MRVAVVCRNCGLRWVRITPESDGEIIELFSSLIYNCPACGSNYYEPIKEE